MTLQPSGCLEAIIKLRIKSKFLFVLIPISEKSQLDLYLKYEQLVKSKKSSNNAKNLSGEGQISNVTNIDKDNTGSAPDPKEILISKASEV